MDAQVQVGRDQVSQEPVGQDQIGQDQIDQLHPAAGAKSSLLSAAAVTRNLEMPSNRSPTAQQIAGAKYLKFIESI